MASIPQSRDEWRERAATLRRRDQTFIDGRFTPARSGSTFGSRNTASGELLALKKYAALKTTWIKYSQARSMTRLAMASR